MPGEIMTEVSAIVAGERAGDVVAAFAELAQRPLPDGLARTELLEGPGGEWKIQSLWRDRATLDAMRAGPNRRPRLRSSGSSARNQICGSTPFRPATPPRPEMVRDHQAYRAPLVSRPQCGSPATPRPGGR
jgi:hypothetical protein